MAEGHWGSGLPSSGPFGPRQGSLGESLFSSAGGADLVNQLQQVARQQETVLEGEAEAEARGEAAENLAVAHAEVTQHQIGTPPGFDPVTRLLTLLEAANARNERLSERSERLMDVVLRRLDGESGQTQGGQASQGAPGSGASVPHFGSQSSGVNPGHIPGGPSQRPFAMTSEGKLPFGVNLPMPDYKAWKNRHSELLGYRQWLESFLSWLALMSESFPPEVKEALQSPVPVVKTMLNLEQQVRGLRLLSFLRQCFSSFPKVDGIISHYVSTTTEGEAHGFEAFRRIHTELSLQSRAEVMAYRDQTLKFRSRETSLVDIIRSVDIELYQFDMLLSDWNIPLTVPRQEALTMWAALAISEADRTMILLRSVPEHIRIYVSLHHRVNMERYSDLRQCLLEYDVSTRVLGDVTGKLASLDAKGKSKGKKGDGGKKGKQSDSPLSKGKGDSTKGKKGKGDGGKSSRGNSQSSNRSTGKGGKDRKRIGPCFLCGKDGHLRKDCPQNKKGSGSGGGGKSAI